MTYPNLAANKADATTTPTDHPGHHNSLADAANLIPEWVYYLGGRLPGETANGLDDFFTSDTVSNYTAVTPTVSASWSVDGGRLAGLMNTNASQDACCLLISTGGLTAPVTIESVCARVVSGDNYAAHGICFTDGTSTTSNFIGTRALSGSTQGQLGLTSGTITVCDSASAQVASDFRSYGSPGLTYHRLIWKSANTFTAQFSADGYHWADIAAMGNQSKTMTPTHIGFWGSRWGVAKNGLFLFDYIRVYEADLS